MSQLLLEKLGLSPNEAKIYLSLIKSGERGASGISVHTGIHRRNVYDSLSRLLDKGLVQKSLDSKESKYAPVDPIKLKQLLAEKSLELDAELPLLQKEYQYIRPVQESYIVKGHEGIKGLWELMIKERQDIFGFGVKAQWFDPDLESFRKPFFKKLAKHKVFIHLLLDHDLFLKDNNFVRNYEYKNSKGRILPKEYDTTSLVNIFGDYTVFYNQVSYRKIAPDTTFYVIKDKDLAESHRRWFWFMWDICKPV